MVLVERERISRKLHWNARQSSSLHYQAQVPHEGLVEEIAKREEWHAVQKGVLEEAAYVCNSNSALFRAVYNQRVERLNAVCQTSRTVEPLQSRCWTAAKS